jgi:hypothetical protein
MGSRNNMSIIHAQSTIIAGAGGPTGPVVDFNGGNSTVSSSNNPTVAGISINGDGTEKGASADGTGTMNVNRGSWLTSGNAADVWIERTISSGSLSHADPGAGRKSMDGLSYELSVEDTTLPGGAEECILTLKAWDTAGPTGGTELDSVTMTFSATRTA